MLGGSIRIFQTMGGGPKDAPEDDQGEIWGGVIPLALAMGAPEADDTTSPGVAAPPLVAGAG